MASLSSVFRERGGDVSFWQGVCGTAAQTGETQLVEDVRRSPDISRRQQRVGIGGSMTRDGTVIAVIDLDGRRSTGSMRKTPKGIETLAAAISGRI
jgi:GAF domain-containing protein